MDCALIGLDNDATPTSFLAPRSFWTWLYQASLGRLSAIHANVNKLAIKTE
jgi:hypothetical protein